MENNSAVSSPSRRDLLRMIGVAAGSAAMYQAMSSLGFAADSPYRGPIDLQGAPRGASVLILGAGMAGMSAAYELRNAGYQVQVLGIQRPAGRTQLELARRRPLHRTRRPHPGMPVRQGPVHQSGAVADSRITTAAC